MRNRMIFNHKIILLLLLALPLSAAGQQIKIGNYTFSDGGEYQGELIKGKPYGHGTTTVPKGDTHTGEYVKGKRQGQGGYLYSDGEN